MTRRPSGVFIVNFEQISHIVLVFPLLTCKCQLGIKESKKGKHEVFHVTFKWFKNLMKISKKFVDWIFI